MKHILTETRDLPLEQTTITLRYELTAEETDGTVQYGAAVVNLTSGERAYIGGLTADRARAETFFRRVCNGLVTPVTLRDTAEDFAAEA